METNRQSVCQAVIVVGVVARPAWLARLARLCGWPGCAVRVVAAGLVGSERGVAMEQLDRAAMERPNKNVARGEATRAQLIAIATRMFAERGYEDTSVEAVLREAGVSRGSL